MELWIMPIVFFSIFLVIYSLIIMEGKLRNNTMEGSLSCHQYIKNMLELYGYDYNGVTINTKKIYQYNVRENSIGIINLMSCKLFDIIASLHETGHYVVNNRTTRTCKLFKYSQYIIAINRLIVMPILLVVMGSKVIFNYNIIFFNYSYIKYILLITFVISTLLRLFVGLSNEVFASSKANNFIKSKGDKEMLALSKKVYLYGLCNQVFFFVLFTSFEIIVFIYI